jgi:hypothetical protein
VRANRQRSHGGIVKALSLKDGESGLSLGKGKEDKPTGAKNGFRVLQQLLHLNWYRRICRAKRLGKVEEFLIVAALTSHAWPDRSRNL